MGEIDCLACGKTLKMPKYINADKYDGQVVCQGCKSVLHVKLVKGKVEKYRIVENKFKDPDSLSWIDLVKSAEEYEKRQEETVGDNLEES